MTRGAVAVAASVTAMLLAACASTTKGGSFAGGGDAPIPKSLLAGERPIGRGPRFQPSLMGEPVGVCTADLGPRAQAHIELFGSNRVVLLSSGIGTRRPRRFLDGRITRASCFGAIVTLDPTGTVYFRRGERLTLATVFKEWGHPLRSDQMASFSGRVRLYVDGQRSSQSPGALRLAPNAEIVLEVGPYVPPHARFSFPEPPAATLR